jgi:putative nucleotidyltransferase with HDIG domain
MKLRTDKKFIPIILDSLRVDSVLEFELYLNNNGNLILYRSPNMPFTEKTRQKLLENRVDRLFITAEDRASYQRYIEQNLQVVLKDPSIEGTRKAEILYDTSTNLVQEVLENPTLGENVQRSKELVGTTMDYILQGREGFLNLMQISSFDYHLYTHSVNVCTYSIALAQQLGFTDEEFLHELGVGALLHDIGKSKISTRILNKRSELSPIEFEIMKKHPKWGVEILAETDEIASGSYYAVLQHHERGGGKGYPSGLQLDEMHIYSKIVAICDSFDAMTTERVYQHAMQTFPALKILLNNRGAYDEKILRAFVDLMSPQPVLVKT